MNSFFNFLRRNKLYSAVNLLGLSVSMAFVLLLAAYVGKQLGTDSFQKNAGRIYLVADSESLSTGYWFQRHLKANFPEIEAGAAYSRAGVTEFTIDGATVNAEASYADSSFFDIFSFPLVEGSVEEWKASRDRVLISETFARTHFADRDPVGRTVSFSAIGLDYAPSLTIAGVFKDIDNSIIKSCDVFIRGEYMTLTNLANDERMSNGGGSVTFVMTYPGADLNARTGDILAWCRENYWTFSPERGYGDNFVRLIPLRDVYFLQEANEDYNEGLNLGSMKTVALLLTMCLVLLLFAILNYVNMTTALAGFRAKEMATRRLLGATKGNVFLRMMAESTAICAVAMCFAVLIGEAFAPVASAVLNYKLSLFQAISPLSIAACVIFTVFVGIVSGLFPAIVIQKAEPIEIVRGTLRLKTKTLYSKIIIVVQNVISTVMLVTALTMFLQIRSMINAPVGYNTADQIIIDNYFGRADALVPLVDRLKTESCVEEVGLGEGYPMFSSNNSTMALENGEDASFQIIRGDRGYFDILGLRKKQDNHLADGSWWLNEYAYGILGIDESATEFLTKYNGAIGIGGIYYDFKIFPLLLKQHPGLIYQYDEYPAQNWPWVVLVKTGSDHKLAMEQVKAACDEIFPGKMFSAQYVEDGIRGLYASERDTLKIMLLFTVLSLLVSALGLVAMSSYYMQQERRAVSLKKVFGAGYNSVLWRLVAEFMKLVGVSFVIAVPVGWFLMHHWLSGYSYRIGLHWWIFALAGLFTAFVAAVAVLWQSMSAARTNPAVELKKE